MSELQGIARFTFHEGKLEEFKRLSAQCMESVRTKDTGTLQYEIYFNDDQSECIVLERYRDSEALIEHLVNLATYRRRSLRRDRSPASSLVSRARSSERTWLAARFVSSRPSCRCRHRPPAWARLLDFETTLPKAVEELVLGRQDAAVVDGQLAVDDPDVRAGALRRRPCPGTCR